MKKSVCAFICVFAACVFADPDPFADAVHYFVFDTDVNGDGKLQPDEIRDVRHWGTTQPGGYAGTAYRTLINTNDLGAASWTTQSVLDPCRGVARTMPSLSFRCDYRTTETTTNSMSQRVELQGASVTGSVTVVTRVRIDSFAQPNIFGGGNYAWLLFNGQAWNANPTNAAGSCFGFQYTARTDGVATNANVIVMTGANQKSTGISVTTNLWYDIAWTLRDNGDHTATWTCTVRDPDPDKVLNATMDGRCSRGFLTASGTLTDVFHNEARAGAHFRLGGESNARNREGGKSISCDINRLAIWKRVLTQDEIYRAFMADSTTFRIGVGDGTGGEFADETERPSSSYVVDGAPWHDMAQGVSATHPEATFTFTPHNVDVTKVAQVLRLKAAAGDAGETRVDLLINGSRIGATRTLSPGSEVHWDIKENVLRNAANVFCIRRVGGTAAALVFDVIDMGGSWVVGTDNGVNSEFSVENANPIPAFFYPGDWNWAGCQRGMPNTNAKSLTLRFFVSEALSCYGYTYSGRVVQQGASDPAALVSQYGYTLNQWPFAVYLNGEAEPRYTTGTADGVPNGTVFGFDLEPGTLTNGWNTIKITCIGHGTYWDCLDFHRLALHPQPNGTLLIVR